MHEVTTDGVSPPPNTPSPASARFWLGIGLPAAILVAGYLPFLLLRSDLPDRVASHFDGAGRADDSMSVGTFLVVTSVLMLVGLVPCIVIATWRRPLPPGLGAMIGFLGPFLAALGAGILATTAVSQRGIDTWQDAPNLAWSFVIVLVGAGLAGTVGARQGSRLPVAVDDESTADVPVMELADGEEAVWASSLHSSPLLLVGIAVAAGGVVLLMTTPLWIGITMLVSSIPLFAFTTLHVRVDRRGLRVNYGRLPWPSTFVPVEQIETASVIDVRPREWGGWGYRGSIKLMQQAAVVHRAGSGIKVDLRDGKVFVVTVDAAETGTALLNAQVRRGRSID